MLSESRTCTDPVTDRYSKISDCSPGRGNSQTCKSNVTSGMERVATVIIMAKHFLRPFSPLFSVCVCLSLSGATNRVQIGRGWRERREGGSRVRWGWPSGMIRETKRSKQSAPVKLPPRSSLPASSPPFSPLLSPRHLFTCVRFPPTGPRDVYHSRLMQTENAPLPPNYKAKNYHT